MHLHPVAKLKPSVFAAAALACCANYAFAGDVTGKIVQLTVHKGYGNTLFIKMDKPPAVLAACSNNGYWDFTLPSTSDADKRINAMLLLAQATGATVTIAGAGSCSEHGNIESVYATSLSK